ncbi:MAG: ribosomal L7Ae/L30e/S12e/Gadd45 family protein [Clostridia bacterium]|nr:ribosomal L7Ae/L30e/S12e/Gadd45 family protein [Clostridia bacterium]
MNQKILNLLGLCRKSGNLSLGYDAVVDSIKKKKAKVCLVAADSSDRVKEKMKTFSSDKNIECFITNFEIKDFEKSIGKAVGVLSVDEKGFSKKIKTLLGEGLNDN